MHACSPLWLGWRPRIHADVSARLAPAGVKVVLCGGQEGVWPRNDPPTEYIPGRTSGTDNTYRPKLNENGGSG